jgi:uncharacterized membrane protein YdjX (TVP38/TMEM64 family)
MKKLGNKLIIAVLIGIGCVLILYYIGFARYFSLESIKTHATYFKQLVEQHYISSVMSFIFISTVLFAFTLPVTGPVAVVAGYLFGLWPAVLYSMIAGLIGTAISFLVVRHAMTHITRDQYNNQLTFFKRQFHAYGYTYLISLQLLTVVPYFVINTLAALAEVPFITFMWTTALGSFPIVVIYAFAGRQLYMIQSWRDIVSVNMLLLLLGLALLALLPMIVKKIRGTTKVLEE